MEHCTDCSRDFKNKNSLRTHTLNFHRNQPPNNQSTIAIVNRNHNDKGLMSLDSTSGESSDSDETIHSDDELDESLKVVDETISSEFDSDDELDEGLEIVD